jgi:hypothetical protein
MRAKYMRAVTQNRLAQDSVSEGCPNRLSYPTMGFRASSFASERKEMQGLGTELDVSVSDA